MPSNEEWIDSLDDLAVFKRAKAVPNRCLSIDDYIDLTEKEN